MEQTDIQEKVVELLRTVYDPEIPVNTYDLGLIYRIELWMRARHCRWI